MSSLGHLSDRDLERLSAYLDGQLDRGETARLEARLKREPQLQQALDELRLPRQLLRSLPTLRPPRSFTLTPEMAGRRRGGHAYPALRLATALATLTFLVVSGLDVLGRSVPTAMAPAAGMVGRTGASLVETEAGEALLAPAPTEAPAERGLEAPQAPEPMLGAEAPPPSEPSEELQSPAVETPLADWAGPSGGGGAPNAPTPEGSRLAPTQTAKWMVAVTETPSPTAVLIPAATEPAPVEALPMVQPGPAPQWGLRWLELGLGALAVGFGMLSLVVRRKR
jgi:anti-sigma factor RsiW